ncbi:MAG: hypothetical protein Q8R44_10290 [Novosphingobium sp.]|nr:hypothetical protein [Novosphingobium sp.]
MSILWASALALAAVGAVDEPAGHAHDHHPQLGEVRFDTACAHPAAEAFREGLGWLHSFQYEQAARTFAEAAARDPDCAIARWGIAMSHFHPLWAPPSAAELEAGRRALAEARTAGTASTRERDYIAALNVFYDDSGKLDHKRRVLAYGAAMEALHARYPDDHEAAVFNALALMAAGAIERDPGFARERRAGEILNRVFAAAPEHPGVTHYLIHTFDYPTLADLALPAARRYAQIAPDSPHALHMPSHIFVRLGLWDEAIASNVASEASARTMARKLGLPGASSEQLHAMDYLAYGYLQTGQDAKAEAVLADLLAMRRIDPPVFQVAFAVTAIPARLALERKQWKAAAALELTDRVRTLAHLGDFSLGEAHLRFARAIGTARSGNVAAARREVAEIEAIENALTVPSGAYDWRTQVTIARRIAAAWLARAEGRDTEAVAAMRAAADLDDATEKHPVTPGAILPAREQLGELLLELDRPGEALEAFRVSLQRAPNRLFGLAGAARAASLAGRADEAQRLYAQIVAQTAKADATRAEVAEARAAVKRLSVR